MRDSVRDAMSELTTIHFDPPLQVSGLTIRTKVPDYRNNTILKGSSHYADLLGWLDYLRNVIKDLGM